MTQRNDARLAGVLYLSYIVLNVLSAALFGRAAGGSDVVQRLTNIQRMITEVRIVVLLDLLQVLCAVGLAVTLYHLTRAVDGTIAMIAMMFRTGEGLFGVFYIGSQIQLMHLAATLRDHATTAALFGSYVFNKPGGELSELCFVVGGLLFACLFLRGRLIPSPLAWIGVISIAAQAVCVPLRIAGLIHESIVDELWLVIMCYEIPLGIWLIARGIKTGDSAIWAASRVRQ